MRASIKPFLIGFGGALLAILLTLFGLTAWVDHVRITTMWTAFQQEIARQAQSPQR